jgi:hypothetical protein
LDDNNGIIMNPLYFTGAAYVVISHGENGVGAISNAQILISSPAMGVDGPLEALNHNNGNAVSSVSTTISPQFRDAPFSATDAAYFDDYLVRPTVFSLIQRAQVGPRSH